MTAVKQWSAEAIEAAVAAQGVALGPGRGERLARGQQSLLDAGSADPLRASLELDTDPPGFVLALGRWTAR